MDAQITSDVENGFQVNWPNEVIFKQNDLVRLSCNNSLITTINYGRLFFAFRISLLFLIILQGLETCF